MRNRIMQIVAMLGLTAATLAAHAGRLPEFMDAQQLSTWRAQHAAPTAAVVPTANEQSSFFTGKPFDAASGTYLFKYRSYSPDVARWTSADPSGFPDGANNMIYAPVPTHGFDPLGLKSVLWAYTTALSPNHSFIDPKADARDNAAIDREQGDLASDMRVSNLHFENGDHSYHLYDVSNFQYQFFDVGTTPQQIIAYANAQSFDLTILLCHGLGPNEFIIGGEPSPANSFANAPKIEVHYCYQINNKTITLGEVLKVIKPQTKTFLQIE